MKIIATNPIAFANYFINEVVEAGIQLSGTEIKSIRQQAPSLRDAFVEIKPSKTASRFEAWLVHLHIAPYGFGNRWNHEPLQPRKLLLHAYQLKKLYGAILQEGMTLIPLKLYYKRSRVKVELGLGKGKKKYDKREDLKKRAVERDLQIDWKKKRS